MRSTFIKVLSFTLALLASFTYMGYVITSLSGGPVRVVQGVGPEAGEAIFWGKGTCYTCHAIGDRGSSIRGPNQGATGPLGMAIGERAAERGEERSAETGVTYTAVDYLLESMIEPNVYVVEGYKAEMPVVTAPPVALGPEEIQALIAYLLSQDGDSEPLEIERSPFWQDVLAASAKGAAADPFRLYLQGDAEAGRELFFSEQEMGCSRCHAVGEQGGRVGPELTMVAATRSVPFLIESILDPNATVASGYEQTIVQLLDWSEMSGIKTRETDEILEIADTLGELHTISKSEIEEMETIPGSVMPTNFGELLSVAEFHDLVAFVLTLHGATAEPAESTPQEETE